MTNIKANYYSADSSQAYPVTVQLLPDGRVQVDGDGIHRAVAVANLVFSTRIANLIRTVSFDDGALCEVSNNDAVDQYLAELDRSGIYRYIHRLEQGWTWVIAAIALLVAFAAVFMVYIVPGMANLVAHTLPRDVDEYLGRDSLRIMDELIFSASTLDAATQARLTHRFDMLATDSGLVGQVELLFRDGGEVGPNAFALPSGKIVMTDELVRLAETDDELAAVLAHEIGHVSERHTLRLVLQDSVTALVFATMLGDMTSITGLAGAIPALLMQTSYSRKFETQADDFALVLMRESDIDPAHFAAILRRLDAASAGRTGQDFLSTHPATQRRIARFE